ncbi:Vacuolar protein-sorting-associated protein 24 [Mortierella alpina]|nr:Vacuolar protein-sorting-associated protein 24 [Mortierella alpina]KAF9954765.1 Vacuolar protein-sorting-associated protein 24 [Mortierella alpina]KAF9965399.1 Vacuolar protein-sorting-associated protein 24 [Mortierella alpina]KAF9990070.1 Vacuolar protein-sorting-associated protein 24 [Mortierella antarctica]
MASTLKYSVESVQRFFGKKTPEEMVRKWRQEINAQQRALDRQKRAMETEELKVKRSIQQIAKKGDIKTCKMLAKELVHSRRQKDRIVTSKAQLNSISMQLQHQLATLKIAGTLQKSSEVMSMVNNLVKLPEISAQMQEMSKEMMRAGLIDEMLQDTMEAMDDDEIEEEAEEEVNKVLFSITNGLLGEAPLAAGKLPTEAEEEEEEPALDDMQRRLEALKS